MALSMHEPGADSAQSNLTLQTAAGCAGDSLAAGATGCAAWHRHHRQYTTACWRSGGKHRGEHGRHLRRLSSSLGRLLELPAGKQALKVLAHQGFGAWQVASPRQRQCQVQVVELRAHKGHHRLLVHCGQQHLTPPACARSSAQPQPLMLMWCTCTIYHPPCTLNLAPCTIHHAPACIR